MVIENYICDPICIKGTLVGKLETEISAIKVDRPFFNLFFKKTAYKDPWLIKNVIISTLPGFSG